MLNQIKTLLNIEVKLEEMKLENGTVVSAESFEKDKEIFIVTDDEKVAMPVGEYLLEDGRLVVISEEVKAMMPAKEEEMSEEAANVLKSRTVKEEFSEAAAAPIKHNPEGESVTKKKVEFAKGNFNTTAMERVLNKLNK